MKYADQLNVKKLDRSDLLSLEDYAEARPGLRAKVLAHKQNRRVQLGPNVLLLFEDRLTIRYQVQEMLRIERIFERAGIQSELDAYNPLIPDGSNLKATMQIEFEDVEVRRSALAALRGIEDSVWFRVSGFDRVFAIADEDLDRENDTKTSAVHFLRFELSPDMGAAMIGGENVGVGCDHSHYQHEQDPVPRAVRDALAVDLD